MIRADLRDPVHARRAVHEANRIGGGRLDGVVNALGVAAFGEVHDLDPDTLDELFLTNLFAPVYV